VTDTTVTESHVHEPAVGRSTETLQVIAAVVSPVALATALLFYFGWVRSQAQAEAFGAEVSIFEMTPEDLVLRSVNVLFFPLLIALLLALAALRLDPWLRKRGSVLGEVLRYAVLAVPIGLALVLVGGPVGEVGRVLLPLLVMFAIGGTAYGVLLRRQAAGDMRRPRLVSIGLVATLLIGCLFWQTERLAQLGGEALADGIIRGATRLPPVTLLSAQRLQIDAPGVVEDSLVADNGAYAYRYEGLYLLQRSGDKYFLLTPGWADKQGRLLVIPDSHEIRLEFRQPTPSASPLAR
jgi:hypothetical protein